MNFIADQRIELRQGGGVLDGLVTETGLAERLLESEVEVLRDRGSEQATEEGSKRLTAGMPSIKSNLYEIMLFC